MKGIMFNEKYGLESAVLNGNKTRTWREDKKPRYKVDEIVAIKQCYKDVCDYFRNHDNRKYIDYIALCSHQEGWRNKMFVKNELMPHHIRITAVKKCRLQDLTHEDCLKEGIKKLLNGFAIPNLYHYHSDAKGAFRNLIDYLMGCSYWESNPEGYAYEFELVK